MGDDNRCIPGGPGQLSRCGACDDLDRSACPFFFPAGPWSNGCMHHREEFGDHCDNSAAQHSARNEATK